MDPTKDHALVLFGGDKAWQASDWTSSDDRVRGGKSQSYFDCTEKVARFHGTLDIDTLGGAGFASQRTTGDDRKYDLSKYAGVQLQLAKGDKKRYTFILKDDILPPDPDTGREQSTVSWEVDFDIPAEAIGAQSSNESVFISFKSFNPTYRGRVKKDAKALDVKNIKRMSIMMRSYFGTQKGDFSLSIRSIRALPKAPPPKTQDLDTDCRCLEEGLASAKLAEDDYVPFQEDVLQVDSFDRRRLGLCISGLLGVAALWYLGGWALRQVCS